MARNESGGGSSPRQPRRVRGEIRSKRDMGLRGSETCASPTSPASHCFRLTPRARDKSQPAVGVARSGPARHRAPPAASPPTSRLAVTRPTCSAPATFSRPYRYSKAICSSTGRVCRAWRSLTMGRSAWSRWADPCGHDGPKPARSLRRGPQRPVPELPHRPPRLARCGGRGSGGVHLAGVDPRQVHPSRQHEPARRAAVREGAHARRHAPRLRADPSGTGSQKGRDERVVGRVRLRGARERVPRERGTYRDRVLGALRTAWAGYASLVDTASSSA